MNLRHLDQKIDIERSEARALQQSLQHYHYHLAQLATTHQLTHEQALSIKPTTRVLTRLTRMLIGPWPKYPSKRLFLHRARKWQLEFDEMLVLLAIWTAGDLHDGGHCLDMHSVMGKIDQKAQYLSSYFRI